MPSRSPRCKECSVSQYAQNGRLLAARAQGAAVDEKRCAVRPLVRQRDPVGGETGKPAAALVTKRRVRAPPPKCVTGRPDSTRSRFPFSSRAATVPAVPESYRLPPGAAPLPAPSGARIVAALPPHPPVQGQAGRKELCRKAQRASGSPNWLLFGERQLPVPLGRRERRARRPLAVDKRSPFPEKVVCHAGAELVSVPRCPFRVGPGWRREI